MARGTSLENEIIFIIEIEFSKITFDIIQTRVYSRFISSPVKINNS